MPDLCIGTMIPGPRGRDGVDGVDGAAGATGATGATGPAGADGSLTGNAGGDLLGSTYPNPIVAPNVITSAKMSATGVVAGVYGSSTLIPVITVDAAGRSTSITEVAVAASGTPSGAAGPPGDLVGSYPNNLVVDTGKITTAKLAVTGVAAGTYGSGTAIPVMTLDVSGRVTAISTIAPVFTGVAPTASNAQVVGSGTNFTVPGTAAWVDVVFGGTQPTTPPLVAGTYLIFACVPFTLATTGAFDFGARLYNVTAATPLVPSWYGADDASAAYFGQATLLALTTIAVTSSITLQGFRSFTGVGTSSVDVISTRTTIGYIRLS